MERPRAFALCLEPVGGGGGALVVGGVGGAAERHNGPVRFTSLVDLAGLSYRVLVTGVALVPPPSSVRGWPIPLLGSSRAFARRLYKLSHLRPLIS